MKAPRLTLWVAIVAVIPLFVNPLGRWQYEPDKLALLLALTGALAGLSLPALANRARPGWVERAAGAYLLVCFVTVALSISSAQSLWGDPAWRNGLLQVMAGIGLFVLARRTVSAADRESLVSALLVGSGIVALYGVVQYAGLDPFKLREDTARTSSTLAHANFLAAYLAMVMPVTLYRALNQPHRRAMYVLLLVVQAFCLVFTYSRSGWLGAGAGLALVGLLGLWRSGQRRTALVVFACCGIGLAAVIVLSLLPPLSGDAPHVLQNLTNMFRWQGATAQIRLLGWQSALEAIGSRPLFGYGQASFRTVLEWTMQPGLAPFGGGAALDGRVHNRYLEITLECGIVGLAVYLVFIGAVLAGIARRIRGTAGLFGAAVLGALCANLVNNFFSFDCVATWTLFCVLAGLAGDLPIHIERHRKYVWGRRAAALAGILAALWMSVPDMLARAGEALGEPNLLRAAVALAPVPEAYMGIQAEVNARHGAAWQDTAQIYRDMVARAPESVSAWHLLGIFLQRAYEGGQDTGQEAFAAYSRAIQLSPRDPDRWIDRALLAVRLHDLNAAQADLAQAGSLLADYTRYDGAMAVLALARNDLDAAAMWQERAQQAQQAWDNWSWRR